MRPTRPALPVRLAALGVALLAGGCDLIAPQASVYFAYAAETTHTTDVYLDRKRVLDNARPGEVSELRKTGTTGSRVDLAPQALDFVTLGPRRFLDFRDGGTYVAVVVGTQALANGLFRDTLAVTAFPVPSPGTLRVVNGTDGPVDVYLVARGAPLAAAAPVRLARLGDVSPAVPAAAEAVVTPGGSPTILSRTDVPAGAVAVVAGSQQAYPFAGPAPKGSN